MAIWQTKDGRRLNVKDMTDQHVKNTYKMLRRYVDSQNYLLLSMAAYISHAPDGAAMACEQEMDREIEPTVNAELWLRRFEQELETRNLVVM